MEVVASCVNELGKSKIVHLPAHPVTVPTTSQTRGQSKPRRKKDTTAYADWYSKQYKGTEEQRRKDRENRRLLCEQKQKENEEELARKVKELQLLGDEEDVEDEAETHPEPQAPPPAPSKTAKPVEMSASKNKRYEMERRRKEKAARDAEKATVAAQPTNPPQGKESG